MPYVTIHTLDGDAEELATRKSTLFDPAVREVAPAFGAIASVTAKTDSGLTIVNVWESAEQVAAFTAHPAIQTARDAARSRRRYSVLSPMVMRCTSGAFGREATCEASTRSTECHQRRVV
jgi:hypothetical protein